jgi:hypothetical protein
MRKGDSPESSSWALRLFPYSMGAADGPKAETPILLFPGHDEDPGVEPS